MSALPPITDVGQHIKSQNWLSVMSTRLASGEPLDLVPCEKAGSVFREQSSVESRRLKFADVLTGKALVGRQQDDAVQLVAPPRLAEVMQVLADVAVHEQRFAAALAMNERWGIRPYVAHTQYAWADMLVQRLGLKLN